VLQIELVLYSK